LRREAMKTVLVKGLGKGLTDEFFGLFFVHNK
jgi:hypothetical protein